MPFLELGDDGLLSRPVVLALEGRGYRRLQLVDEALHVVLELHPPPGRQTQGARLVRVREVVDGAPVRGDIVSGGLLLDVATHRAVPAGARGTEHVEPVAFAPDADAELQRLDGACLADGAATLPETRQREIPR